MIDRNNLNYDLLLNNEYSEVLTDSMIKEALENRRNNLSESESRPQISNNSTFQHSNELSKNEEESIIKHINKNETQKEKDRKTILDMSLKNIIGKTSQVTADFFDDYNIKLIESKYLYEKKYGEFKDKISWTEFFSVHSLAFIEYMKENDNILYIGILLVIIAVILYIFNIS